MFVSTAVVSNSSYNTYYCDLSYVYASCLARAGGYRDDGSNAGAFYLDVDFSASDAVAGIGSRLMFL
jgi:hypothetical protein